MLAMLWLLPLAAALEELNDATFEHQTQVPLESDSLHDSFNRSLGPTSIDFLAFEPSGIGRNGSKQFRTHRGPEANYLKFQAKLGPPGGALRGRFRRKWHPPKRV